MCIWHDTLTVHDHHVHLILCAIWHDTLTVQWPSRKYTWYCVLYDTHVDSPVTITYVHLILCAIWHDTLTVQWPSRKYTWYCVLYDTTRWQSSDHHVSTLDTVCYMTRHVDSPVTITYVHLILCAIWHDTLTVQWPSRKYTWYCVLYDTHTLTVQWPSRKYTWYCVLYDTTRWQCTRDHHVSTLDTVCYMTRHVDSPLTIT